MIKAPPESRTMPKCMYVPRSIVNISKIPLKSEDANRQTNKRWLSQPPLAEEITQVLLPACFNYICLD